MARLIDEIEGFKVKIKNELWASLWDVRAHDANCEELVGELRALLDKFDEARDDPTVHKTFWMFGVLGGSCENAPRY